MFFLIGLIYTQGTYIAPYSNPNLHISKLRAVHGPVLRLIEQNKIPNYNSQDKWIINGTRIKIENVGDGSFICGKKNDPGVVPCTDQSYNIWYDIERDGEKAYFKTDNNMCLTRTIYDKKFKGYFINLMKCERSDEQTFRMQTVKVSDSSNENGGSASNSSKNNGKQQTNSSYQQNPSWYIEMATKGLTLAKSANGLAVPCVQKKTQESVSIC